jgi:hypothetical protein
MGKARYTMYARRRLGLFASVFSGVLIVSLFILTSWYRGGYAGPGPVCAFTEGAVVVGFYLGPNPNGWIFEKVNYAPKSVWWPRMSPGPAFLAIVPLWMPFLLSVMTSAVLWRRYYAIPPGLCRQCRYNLTGNVSGVCPECGEKVQRR